MELKELKYTPKHVFEVISEEEKKELEEFVKGYLNFISKVKTERETVFFARELLEEAGLTKDEFLKDGFYVYKKKLLAAWKRGKRSITDGIRVVVSHIDTPRLDLKLHPLFEDTSLAFFKTHYYGGIKKYHWVAMPLAFHGVVVKKDGQTINLVIGENPEDPVFTICDLLPHLARKVQGEKKLYEAIPGEKLNVLIGGIPIKKEDEKDAKEKIKLGVLKLLYDKFGIKEEDFVSAEFYVVPAGPAREVGFDRAFIGGYGQDDRVCAYTSLKAFLEVEEPEYTILLLFMDKEEIGSEGNTSAKSRIVEKVIYDLIKASGLPPTPDVFFEVISSSQLLSADVTAGIDPNYAEVHDKLNDAKLGYGVAVSRYTGHGGKYMANEAHVEFLAGLLGLWEKEGVVYQVVSMGKVDEGGGGTVAKFFASYGMDVVDVGPPLLSMHSPFEISHKADVYMTYKAFKTFYKSE